MPAPKLRIVYYENEQGVQSYIHLEKTEATRVIQLFKILPQLNDWTPAAELAHQMELKPVSLRRTLYKLAGAGKIDLMMDGKRQVIRSYPVLFIKKNDFVKGTKKNRYLKPAVYLKDKRQNAQCKQH